MPVTLKLSSYRLTSSIASIEKMFTLSDGKFDLVFNLAAETKYSQSDEVYKEKVLDLSVKCATEAAKQGVERFVEASTAQIYEAKKVGSALRYERCIAHFSLLQRKQARKTLTRSPGPE